jgi:hypothetical protein
VRFGLKADVHGKVYLPNSFVIERDGVLFEFEAAPDGMLSTVTASMHVDAETFAATIGPGSGQSKATFNLTGDPALSSRLSQHLQALESHLAFSSGGALESIEWSTPEELRIPESDEEKPLAAISGFRVNYPGNRQNVVLIPEVAAQLIAAVFREDDDDLVVLKAFWREGMNDYNDRRYIQAYYNFYFVVEGLYANGKSSEAQVLKAFQRSSELNEITEHAVKNIQADEAHWQRMREILSSMGCDETPEGFQQLLVRLRGALHHYSIKNRRVQANPLAELQFHTAAWFAMHFALLGLLHQDSNLPYALESGIWRPVGK